MTVVPREPGILRVYGDESGTMPTDDTDAPFVFAAFGTFGDPPHLTNAERRAIWLARELASIRAFPFIGYVVPAVGYAKTYLAKIAKMDTMSRATRLTTGANKRFLPDAGLEPRNYLWGLCAQAVIVNVVLTAMVRHAVDRVEIVLDEKTLPEPTRFLMREIAACLPGLVFETAHELRDIDPSRTALLKARVTFTRRDVSLRWSDEPGTTGARVGLLLADCMASVTQRSLRRKGRPVLFSELEKAGFRGFTLDLQDTLLAPISGRAAEKWKEHTGLVEPPA